MLDKLVDNELPQFSRVSNETVFRDGLMQLYRL